MRLKDGDTRALEIIMQQYQNHIYKYCYFILGDKYEAEDAVQEIFIKVYLQSSKFRYDRSFIGWIYKIALNHCRSLLRRKKTWDKFKFNFLHSSIGTSIQSAEKEVLSSHSVLLDDYGILSEVEKSILVLHCVEQYTFKEISCYLNIREATVRKKYQRLKKKLLEGEELT